MTVSKDEKQAVFDVRDPQDVSTFQRRWTKAMAASLLGPPSYRSSRKMRAGGRGGRGGRGDAVGAEGWRSLRPWKEWRLGPVKAAAVGQRRPRQARTLVRLEEYNDYSLSLSFLSLFSSNYTE